MACTVSGVFHLIYSDSIVFLTNKLYKKTPQARIFLSRGIINQHCSDE